MNKTFDVDFNYLEDGEWSFGCCSVICWYPEQIKDTLLTEYEDVEVLDYAEVTE